MQEECHRPRNEKNGNYVIWYVNWVHEQFEWLYDKISGIKFKHILT